jgi:uncharacterized BrkB/YihY/UPF0761 family membrane protein
LVLLVWLYLMGNVVLIGGAVTWWSSRGHMATMAPGEDAEPDAEPLSTPSS